MRHLVNRTAINRTTTNRGKNIRTTVHRTNTNRTATRTVRAVVVTTLLACIALLILVPILWGLSTSLKAPDKILEYPPRVIPEAPTIMHYEHIFRAGILRYVLNSAIVTTSTVVGCLLVASLTGFALSRFSFRGRSGVLFAVVVIMSIPLVSLMVPTYTYLAKATNLLDTRLVLVLLYTAYQLPISVWILKSFFDTLPIELEEAAMIDGYTRVQALFKIVLPLSTPGLIAAGLFIAVFSWNDFVIALIMTSGDAVRTLPVGVYFYLGFFGREWGPLLASSIVSIVPIIVVFVVFQRHFLSGMSGGAIKS